MTEYYRSLVCLGLLSLKCLACAYGSNAIASRFPRQLEGRWEVDAVLVDVRSQHTAAYHKNDARLMHRLFTFDESKISDNTPEARDCEIPAAVPVTLRISELLTLTFAPPNEHLSPPSAREYRLPVSGDPLVRAYSIRCSSGHFGPYPLDAAASRMGGEDIGTWIFRMSSGSMAIRWYDQTILILHQIARVRNRR